MITTALLNLVYFFVASIASFFSTLPDVSLGTSISSAITTASGSYAAMNGYFPMDTLIAIALFDLTFETGYFVYKMIRWAYQKVPGVN